MKSSLTYFFILFLFSLMLLLTSCSNILLFILYSELLLMLLVFSMSMTKGFWDISLIIYLAVLIVCEASIGLSLMMTLSLNSSSIYSKFKWV